MADPPRAYGAKPKLSAITSTSWPSVGGAPPKSQRLKKRSPRTVASARVML